MNNVIQLEEHEVAARQRFKGPIIHFLNKNFPVIAWDCYIDLNSGVAGIIATDISVKHGYYIYLDESEHVMQQKLSQAAHEILERFQIKNHQDLIDLPRRVDGEALNAAKGER